MAVAKIINRIRSQSPVVLTGGAIACIWVVVALPVILNLVSAERVLSYALDSSVRISPVRLSSYSFVHVTAYHLVYDLVWFCGLLSIARRTLSAASLIRIFSLGAIGGGALRLLLLWVFGEQGYVVGASLPIVTLLGVLAVAIPEPTSFFSNQIGLKVVTFGGWFLFSIVVEFSRGASWSYLFLVLFTDGFLLVLALGHIRLMRLLALWLLVDVIVWLGLHHRPDVVLADVACLAAGVVYALVENWGRRFALRPQSEEA